MNFRKKNFKKGGGGPFQFEKFHCKFSATGLRKRGGGGSKAVRNFFENSSILVRTGFPKNNGIFSFGPSKQSQFMKKGGSFIFWITKFT